MAASALYGLAGKLVGELCSPVFQDYVGKPWGLGKKKELEKLSNTMSAIQAVLLDAEEKQMTNNQVKDWLVKIKLVFYDLEDLLQEISYESSKRQVKTKNKKAKKVRIFFSSSNQVMYRLKMGGKVNSIKEQLDTIASDSNRFSLAQRHEETPMNRRREETHSFVPIDKFIGREEDKEKVTKLLLESGGVDHSVAVISIIGIGGLGKTTLAQSVYSSQEVKCNFELMMWVCVSDPFDVKLICENIIKSATQNQCEGLTMDVVKNKLKSSIDGKKYLLVFDDVWNDCPNEWMKLEVLLMGGAKGSKIIITARSELVSRAANSGATHVLKGLSHEESWALFNQVALKGVVDPTSSTVVSIGNEVVEMCAGVPLAIKTIGSILGLKRTETDWLDFKKYVLPQVIKNSDGMIVQILKLSYDNCLHPEKMFCVLCDLSKGLEIEKDELIRMWMAHGLIQLDGTPRSLEDIGDQHFMELMDRSLFEVERKKEDGTIRYCKMHDLIHDLALSVGGNEFWSSRSDVNCIDMRTTRHAWVSISPCISSNLIEAKKLRTLVARKLDWKLDSETEDAVITGDFKQLRVLDFYNVKEARVPEFVAGLRFLAYLNLHGNPFESIPESISSMHNLQTLILMGCRNLKELPKGTRNLVSLRHLDVSECDKLSHMPRGLGELTNLRTLTNFVMGPEGADCSELGELKSLVNLRGKLQISNLRGSKAAKRRSSVKRCNPTHPLAELQFITRLVLRWKEDEEQEQEEADRELEILKPHPNLESLFLWNYGGKRFPSWMERDNIEGSFPSIRSIRLQSCKGWRHLPPVGLLPSLRQLYRFDMGDVEYLIYDDKEEDVEGNNNRYFPALEKLWIWDCPLLVVDGKQFMSLHELCSSGYNMETLPGWLPSLPHLQTLRLSWCKKMVSLPEWMGDLKSLKEIRLRWCNSLASIPDSVLHLTSLQWLEVWNCPELYRRYNKESGEDWHQISHIPNVSVRE